MKANYKFTLANCQDGYLKGFSLDQLISNKYDRQHLGAAD